MKYLFIPNKEFKTKKTDFFRQEYTDSSTDFFIYSAQIVKLSTKTWEDLEINFNDPNIRYSCDYESNIYKVENLYLFKKYLDENKLIAISIDFISRNKNNIKIDIYNDIINKYNAIKEARDNREIINDFPITFKEEFFNYIK